MAGTARFSPMDFMAEEAQFGLFEINWGILPGGEASKVAVELLSCRRAMYHVLMGENMDGRTAAEWGLLNEALPAERLRKCVTEVAKMLPAADHRPLERG